MLYKVSKYLLFRDIKPSNILLKFDRQENNLKTVRVSDMTVKLADFGLARYVSQDCAQPSTSTLSTMGTNRYMAPEIREQYFSRETSTCRYTERADIYSAGRVAYELITGSRYLGLNPT